MSDLRCSLGPEEREFFEWLSNLKKQKSKFAMLAKEMKLRQNAQVHRHE